MLSDVVNGDPRCGSGRLLAEDDEYGVVQAVTDLANRLLIFRSEIP